MHADELTTSEDAAAGSGTNDPAATVYGFVASLLQRYRALRDVDTATLPGGTAADERLGELMLVEAALRYARRSADRDSKRPLQLAVLGPTQTGKSTIVNLLLDASVAEISPLAGFTVHPQGFRVGAGEMDNSWAAELFPGWQRCQPSELSRDEDMLERYVLESLDGATTPPAGLPPCVVWDTPDFDTLAAHTYRRGVLEVAALADAHVFVLSKEKYSDLSVWRMLRLLSPLGRPLIICLNKLTPDAAESVIASLEERLADVGGRVASAPIMAFEYQTGLDAIADLSALPAVWELRDRVADRLKTIAATDRTAGHRVFVRQHWSDWTAPLEVELAAAGEWHERVANVLGEARESYRRGFLDHPQRFDTFRRATAELLHLLELPGLAGTLSQVRHVLSWPARRLFAARQAWSARRRKQTGFPRGLGSEEVVLFELIEKLLTDLERDAARRSDPATPGHVVWRALATRIGQHEARLRATFQDAAQQQREDFVPVIRATANRLYEILEQKPALLNTLRAARATTDVAGIALAIKTAGLGINDLLFAPAMFALTTMLTEGALGSYMSHISKELKAQQLEHVTARLIEGVFAKELRDLAADLKDAGLFGVSREQLRAAAQALETWERSDDE